MAVYVDDMEAPLGRMKMCHMVADTRSELLAMVDRIGVDRRHIQHRGTAKEHFDISKGKRKLAVELGAQELGMLDLAAICWARRDPGALDKYLGRTVVDPGASVHSLVPGEELAPGDWVSVAEDGTVVRAGPGDRQVGRVPTRQEAAELPSPPAGLVHVLLYLGAIGE